MIDEYAHVRIKDTGVCGVIVDIRDNKGAPIYTVESDERGAPGGYGDNNSFKLYDCSENELEVI